MSILTNCGLFSLVCYSMLMLRLIYKRIHIAECKPTVAQKPTSFAYAKHLLTRLVTQAGFNFNIDHMTKPQEAFIIQLWRARQIRRVQVTMEIVIHLSACLFLFYAILLVLGQTAWFSFILFEVGPEGHGQLELAGLAFSLFLIFWVWPEGITLPRSNAVHAIILAGVFIVRESEARKESCNFSFIWNVRIILAFVFCNLPFTIAINCVFAVVRACYDVRYAEHHSNLPEKYLDFFKVEITTEVIIAALVLIAESQVHEAVRDIIDSRAARRSESDMKHLLGLLCDAAFYLGPDLHLQAHSPELAALLLREVGRSMEGCDFEQLMQPGDRDRFNSYIEEAVRRSQDRGPLLSDELGRFYDLEGPPPQGLTLELTRCFSTGGNIYQDPLIVRLNAASSTTVCVEIFHIVTIDIHERYMHLIALRELQDTSRRKGSIVQELPPPRHLLLPLNDLPPGGGDSPMPIRNLASLKGSVLQGGGGEGRTDRGFAISSSSGGSSDTDSSNWSSSLSEIDITSPLDTVDLQAEDGEHLIAVWVDAASPNLRLLRVSTGFAKLGRRFRRGDTLPALLVSDSCKVMTKIKEYVDYSKKDRSLYSEDGPQPCGLGKLKFRLNYTLTECSADCRMDLQPILGESDSGSDHVIDNRGCTRDQRVLEACITLTNVNEYRAGREKRVRKDKRLPATVPQGVASSKPEKTQKDKVVSSRLAEHQLRGQPHVKARTSNSLESPSLRICGGPPLQWYCLYDTVTGGMSTSQLRLVSGTLEFSGTISTTRGGSASCRTTKHEHRTLDGVAGVWLVVSGECAHNAKFVMGAGSEADETDPTGETLGVSDLEVGQTRTKHGSSESTGKRGKRTMAERWAKMTPGERRGFLQNISWSCSFSEHLAARASGDSTPRRVYLPLSNFSASLYGQRLPKLRSPDLNKLTYVGMTVGLFEQSSHATLEQNMDASFKIALHSVEFK